MTAHDASQSASATTAHTVTSIATRRPVLSSRNNLGLPQEFTRRETLAELAPFIVSAALALAAIVFILTL